jgi:putative two-component system response regulator
MGVDKPRFAASDLLSRFGRYLVDIKDTNCSVLVVDDDAAIRRLIARIFERRDLWCLEAGDARSALDLAERQEFSLITCDINMPGGSGLGLVREIRARFPDTAVVMVSGTADPETAAIASDLGAFGYVIKPFDTNSLLIAADNALRRRDLEIENRQHRERLESLVTERTAELAATVDRLSRTEQALRESQEEAIQRLAYAAEFRDPATGAHISRMSRICELLARELGETDDRAELIRIASPMHDIGKIGVSDEILRKSGTLTKVEMEEMRKHPTIGGEILAGSDSELLRLGASIALTHHERWNGTGYPNELSGDVIPLEGRIVAIADVFDALTSERSYKPAFEVDRAIAMMTEERGNHFDPDLLDVFISVTDEVVEVTKIAV